MRAVPPESNPEFAPGAALAVRAIRGPWRGAPLVALAAFLVGTQVLIPTTLAAQQASVRRPAPLSKSDLVRMLGRGTYTRGEVVAMIQRSCLSFIPSVGDRQDLRRLGAEASIFAAMAGCGSEVAAAPAQEPAPVPAVSSPAARTPEPGAPSTSPERPPSPDVVPGAARTADFAAPSIPPLLASIPTTWLTARVNETAPLSVELWRDQSPQPGVRLVLRGTEHIPGGPAEALQTTTDEQGLARFEIPAGPAIDRYPLRLAAIGEELNGQSSVTFDVVAGPPVRVEVDPDPFVLSGELAAPAVLRATAFDRFGNRAGRASLTVSPRAADPSLAAPGQFEDITRTTDENGTAPFIIRMAHMLAGYVLDVSSEGVLLASIPVRSPASDAGRGEPQPVAPAPEAIQPAVPDLEATQPVAPAPEETQAAGSGLDAIQQDELRTETELGRPTDAQSLSEQLPPETRVSEPPLIQDPRLEEEATLPAPARHLPPDSLAAGTDLDSLAAEPDSGPVPTGLDTDPQPTEVELDDAGVGDLQREEVSEVVGVLPPVDTAGVLPADEPSRYEWFGPPEVADEIRPRKELAEAVMERGDHVAALRLYREIVGLAPEDPVAWFELGRALGLAGHWEEARSVFIHAADLDRTRRRFQP